MPAEYSTLPNHVTCLSTLRINHVMPPIHVWAANASPDGQSSLPSRFILYLYLSRNQIPKPFHMAPPVLITIGRKAESSRAAKLCVLAASKMGLNEILRSGTIRVPINAC